MFDTELPGESQVSDSTQTQDEPTTAPVSDSQPAEVEEEADEPEPEPKRPAERTVPVSALIEERRRYQNRIQEIRRELDDLKRGSKRSAAQEEPASDYDKQVRTWQKNLGVTELREQLDELSEAIEQISGKVGRVDELSHGANLAVTQYVNNVEQYALSQYDESLPISRNQFDKLVAAEFTPEEAEDIFRGNYKAIDAAVKRVKMAFKRPNANVQKKAAEVNKVRNLPKVPASGGTAPKATPDAKPFTSMRDLHNDAWEDFNSLRTRQE